MTNEELDDLLAAMVALEKGYATCLIATKALRAALATASIKRMTTATTSQERALTVIQSAEEQRLRVVDRLGLTGVPSSEIIASLPDEQAERLRLARRRLLQLIRRVQEEMRITTATVQTARTVTARALHMGEQYMNGYGPRLPKAAAKRSTVKEG